MMRPYPPRRIPMHGMMNKERLRISHSRLREFLISPKEIPFYITLIYEQYRRVNKNRKLKYKLPSILFLGPPGVGKSEMVRETARFLAARKNKKFIDYSEISKMMISKQYMMDAIKLVEEIIINKDKYFLYADVRLSTVEPYDIQGIIKEKILSSLGISFSENVPFIWALLLQFTDGLLFLDEITHISRDDMISVAYQIALDRRIGNYTINDEVLIVAAGNMSHHTSIARTIDEALRNRFIIFYVRVPEPDEWIKYEMERAKDNTTNFISDYVENRLNEVLEDDKFLGVHPVVARFVKDRGVFRKPVHSKNLNYMSPRTLRPLSILLTGLKDCSVIKRIAFGLIGKSIDEFLEYINYRDSYAKDLAFQLLEDPESFIKTKENELIVAIEYLMFILRDKVRNDKENARDLIRKIIYLTETIKKEYGSIELVSSALKKLDEKTLEFFYKEVQKLGNNELIFELAK